MEETRHQAAACGWVLLAGGMGESSMSRCYFLVAVHSSLDRWPGDGVVWTYRDRTKRLTFCIEGWWASLASVCSSKWKPRFRAQAMCMGDEGLGSAPVIQPWVMTSCPVVSPHHDMFVWSSVEEGVLTWAWGRGELIAKQCGVTHRDLGSN